jgi:hypothetical protein
LVVFQANVAALPDATDAGVAESVSVGAGTMTLTVTLCVTVPPAPVQASVNDDVADKGAVTALPLVDFAPDQSPFAEQAVVLVLFQLSVTVDPEDTVAALACSDNVGAGGATTDTVTLAEPVPPPPVQASANVVVVDSAAVAADPEVAFAPDQPPDAVHVLALVLLQVSVAPVPGATEATLLVSDTVGAGGAVTLTVALVVALPPAPVHTSVKTVVVESACVTSLPDVVRAPDQPPEAVQLVALVLLQVSVVVAPAVRLLVPADSVTVGTGDGDGDRVDATGVVPASPPPPQAVSISGMQSSQSLPGKFNRNGSRTRLLLCICTRCNGFDVVKEVL